MAERKRPIDHVLDLFVYAPLGFVMNMDEVVPQLVEKGHQQVQMARMFGKFAVDSGTKELRKRVERVAERPARDEAATTAEKTVATAAAPATAPAPPEAPAEDVPSSIELPITDYDSLSASQVVPRLEGLSPEERDAVRRYEAAHRGRKTILSKLAQLG